MPLSETVLTLLLQKGLVESVAYHAKKAVSAVLVVLLKGHYSIDPVDHVDLTVVPVWVRV
jgi:hypothetical protein